MWCRKEKSKNDSGRLWITTQPLQHVVSHLDLVCGGGTRDRDREREKDGK